MSLESHTPLWCTWSQKDCEEIQVVQHEGVKNDHSLSVVIPCALLHLKYCDFEHTHWFQYGLRSTPRWSCQRDLQRTLHKCRCNEGKQPNRPQLLAMKCPRVLKRPFRHVSGSGGFKLHVSKNVKQFDVMSSLGSMPLLDFRQKWSIGHHRTHRAILGLELDSFGWDSPAQNVANGSYFTYKLYGTSMQSEVPSRFRFDVRKTRIKKGMRCLFTMWYNVSQTFHYVSLV